MQQPGPNTTELLQTLTLDRYHARQPLDTHADVLWPAWFIENFDGAFNWRNMTGSTTAGDYVQEAIAAAALVGDKGMHLKTRTTGAAVGDCCAMAFHACHGPCNFMQYRGATCIQVDSTAAHCDFLIFFVNGVKRYKAGLRLANNGHTYHLDSAGSWREDTELMPIQYSDSWNYFDLFINVKEHKYVYLNVNGEHLNLIGHTYEAIQEFGDWYSSCLALDIMLYADANPPAEAYIDQLCVRPFQHAPLD